MERGEGGPELIDHCDDEISLPSLSSSSTQLSYWGLNDLCGDLMEHKNDVITRSSPYGGAANILQITMLTYRCSSKHHYTKPYRLTTSTSADPSPTYNHVYNLFPQQPWSYKLYTNFGSNIMWILTMYTKTQTKMFNLAKIFRKLLTRKQWIGVGRWWRWNVSCCEYERILDGGFDR